MAWLSTMAFAESADMRVLQALAAFYRLQTMTTSMPRSVPVFALSDGNTWKISEIKIIVRSACKSFDGSAESKLPKQGSETNN